MRTVPVALTIIFVLVGLGIVAPVLAQSSTDTEIVFTDQKKEEARQQLRRILSTYDLDPWIQTQEVRIAAGVDPHSRPILTLNTDHLDDDLRQLSIFLDEQAHWLPRPKRVAAVQDLEALYPEIPGVPEENRNYAGTEDATYHHLIVGWVTLDAMTELVGEATAREIMKTSIDEVVAEPYVAAERSYIWYTNRVLTDTQQIGAILARHDLVITPEKGLVVRAGED